MADRLLDAVIMFEELLDIGHRERCLGRQVAVWIGGVARAEALPLPMAEPGADGGQRRVASQREPRDANPRGIDLRPERRISQQLVDEDGAVARPFPPENEPLHLLPPPRPRAPALPNGPTPPPTRP